MSNAVNPESVPRTRLANLLGQITFGLLAMTLCLPSMQQWAQTFGSDQASVQLTFSAYVVAYGLFQPVFGQLSDRHGRKRILLAGLGLALFASILAALASELSTLIIARALQGAGGAAGVVVARSMVQDLFSGPERTRVMAYIGMTMGLCPPLATVIGGQIHVRFGWQMNFVLIAVIACILMVTAWRGFPTDAHRASAGLRSRGKPVAGSSTDFAAGSASGSASGSALDSGSGGSWLRSLASAYLTLVRDARFMLYLVILAMTTAAFYTFLAGAPLVLGSSGVGPDGVGFYIMFVPLSYILGNFLTSRMIRQTGEQRMMAYGQLATISGLLLMLGLGAAGVNTPLAFAGPLILFGIGHGFLMPPALAGSVGLVPALAGSAAGAAGLMQQLTGAAAGYSVGFVSHRGPVNLGLLMLAFTLVALVAQWRLHRRRTD